jgi:hypothetical protein
MWFGLVIINVIGFLAFLLLGIISYLKHKRINYKQFRVMCLFLFFIFFGLLKLSNLSDDVVKLDKDDGKINNDFLTSDQDYQEWLEIKNRTDKFKKTKNGIQSTLEFLLEKNQKWQVFDDKYLVTEIEVLNHNIKSDDFSRGIETIKDFRIAFRSRIFNSILYKQIKPIPNITFDELKNIATKNGYKYYDYENSYFDSIYLKTVNFRLNEKTEDPKTSDENPIVATIDQNGGIISISIPLLKKQIIWESFPWDNQEEMNKIYYRNILEIFQDNPPQYYKDLLDKTMKEEVRLVHNKVIDLTSIPMEELQQLDESVEEEDKGFNIWSHMYQHKDLKIGIFYSASFGSISITSSSVTDIENQFKKIVGEPIKIKKTDPLVEGQNESKEEKNLKFINLPFNIGDTLNNLVSYYGQPTGDTYFSGGRVVFFDKLGYFLDEEEKVDGFWVTSPVVNIFNSHIGMTPNEISSIISKPVESSYDESELQNYTTKVSIGNYLIFYESESKNGPTTSAIISYIDPAVQKEEKSNNDQTLESDNGLKNDPSSILLSTITYGTVSVIAPENWIESPIEGGNFGGIKLINPNDGNQEMSIIVSSCAGCAYPLADTSLPPEPLSLIPEGATESRVLSSGLSASYTYYTLGNPYSRDGVVIIQPGAGYAIVEVQLPDNEKSVATTVLNSFNFNGYK